MVEFRQGQDPETAETMLVTVKIVSTRNGGNVSFEFRALVIQLVTLIQTDCTRLGGKQRIGVERRISAVPNTVQNRAFFEFRSAINFMD